MRALILAAVVLLGAAGLVVALVTRGHDPITEWRAVGSAPLSDAEAADRVTSVPEVEPGNVEENAYVPTDEELEAFRNARYAGGVNAGQLASDVIPTLRRVTGRFSGTTDEILQWAAHKWGIPEDVVRAVASNESSWSQAQLGDVATGVDASEHPPFARRGPREAYESLGLMQVRWRADGTLHPGSEPLRWKSSAFNVDYWAANVRFFYGGGARRWFESGSTYEPGDPWASIGGWFLPTPWNNAEARDYIRRVQERLRTRAWERHSPRPD